MFRVLIEQSDSLNNEKVIDVTMKTETLYNVLGRFLHRYGSPELLICEDGVIEYDFYKQVGTGWIGCKISYGRIGKDSELVVTNKTEQPKPTTQPIENEPIEERLQALLSAGCVIKKPMYSY